MIFIVSIAPTVLGPSTSSSAWRSQSALSTRSSHLSWEGRYCLYFVGGESKVNDLPGTPYGAYKRNRWPGLFYSCQPGRCAGQSSVNIMWPSRAWSDCLGNSCKSKYFLIKYSSFFSLQYWSLQRPQTRVQVAWWVTNQQDRSQIGLGSFLRSALSLQLL